MEATGQTIEPQFLAMVAMRLRGGGCGSSKPRALATAHHRSRYPLEAPTIPDDVQAVVDALDSRLAETLRSANIRLLRVSWLMSRARSWTWLRRQELEAIELEGVERPFLSPEEATALLRSNVRGIGAVSHGWLSPDHPDRTGSRIGALLPFLASHPNVVGLFYDFASLPQRPRTSEEEAIFHAGLEVMADLYASPFGSIVLQLTENPPCPPGLEGCVTLSGLEDGVPDEAIASLFQAHGGGAQPGGRDSGRMRAAGGGGGERGRERGREGEREGGTDGRTNRRTDGRTALGGAPVFP